MSAIEQKKETLTIELLKQQLQTLQTTYSSPRLHLVEYFSLLTFKVDMSYIELHNDESEMQATSDYAKIVEEIKRCEQECLDKLLTNEFEEEFSEQMSVRIKECEIEVDNAVGLNQDGMTRVGQLINKTFSFLQSRIFLKRTLRFLDKADISIICKNNHFFLITWTDLDN